MLQIPFKPRAQILLQLGEQLIKNENIAILELVKNAYDADAKKVVVNMHFIDDKDTGYIEIHDDGCGMSMDIIKDIWMEPGNSHKKDVVERKERSDLGRLPIGEKGIGRFAILKLGRDIKIITRPEGSDKEYFVDYDLSAYDDDFLTREGKQQELYIDDIKITLVEESAF